MPRHGREPSTDKRREGGRPDKKPAGPPDKADHPRPLLGAQCPATPEGGHVGTEGAEKLACPARLGHCVHANIQLARVHLCTWVILQLKPF